jgi:small-conductance mechanosensitive channel
MIEAMESHRQAEKNQRKEDRQVNIQEFWVGTFAAKLTSTVVLVVVVLILRKYVVHWITHKEALLPTHKRQWIVRVRNITLFLTFGILVVVWIEQLRTIAASIVVIAAAIVIATKEFLLNIVGFFYRTTSKFVSVGDRIDIGGSRGDVIDQSLMGITLLEIGPGDKTHQYTGLTIFLPNSLFLSATVKNETFLWSDYVFHLMTIPIKSDSDWKIAEKALMQAAADVSRPYIENARDVMKAQALQQNLEEPHVEPRVQIQVSEPDVYCLVLRIPVPTRKRARLEQEITRRYLSLVADDEANIGKTD